MRQTGRPARFRLLFAIGPIFLFFTAAAQGDTNTASFVGSAVCKACHPDVWFTFYKNPHYRSLLKADTPPENVGCEGCHGPGKAHVEAHGGKTSIKAFSLLAPAERLNICLRCHSESLARSNIRRSPHTENGVACNDCHSIHKPATPKYLLAKTQSQLCYSCHANVRGDFELPYKHRVNEGFMSCSDCHNPHGTNSPTWRMAARPSLVAQVMPSEEACLRCHSDKRGPFAFEHPPVRVEGCEICHSPHGSTNSRLLRRPVVFTMCLECHNGAPPFGREGDGIQPLSSTHNMTNPQYQNCTNCHIAIHGSNMDFLFRR